MRRRSVATLALMVACVPGDSSQDVALTEIDGMVWIPAGEFWRGCDPVATEDWGGVCEDDPDGDIALDVPMRSIELSEFWIDEHEATLGEYLACFDAGVCPGIGAVVPPNVPEEDRNRLPINGVSWFEAETYCAWRGKRLPTEAEWEKAARGSDQRQLPWGDDRFTCGIGNLRAGESDASCDEPLQVLPVDAYPSDVSPYGVIGMGGNVQEWVADWKGQLYYSAGPTIDPAGPREAEAEFPMKILRGAYHDMGGPGFRLTLRRWAEPDAHLPGRVGVRCASSVAEFDDPLAAAEK